MTVLVFIGPTLDADRVREELPAAEVLPPVAQGDVYLASLRAPTVMAIVDGYFETVPAVWHKEILWAMAHGTHVFGCASMGALRAVELEDFGMEGVGRIFEAYRDGSLEDDDEVAVAHAPADAGYRQLSEPLVNVRRTLAEAVADGVIGERARRELLDVAKSLFYPERHYDRILSAGEQLGVHGDELLALKQWLPSGRVDQKAEDTVTMLRTIRERVAAGMAPKQVRFALEYTDFWDRARLGAAARADRDEPDHAPAARHEALLRYLASREADRIGMTVTDEHVDAMIDEFRRDRDLRRPEALEAWLAEIGLSREAFSQIMRDEAKLRWMEHHTQPEVYSRLEAVDRLARRGIEW